MEVMAAMVWFQQLQPLQLLEAVEAGVARTLQVLDLGAVEVERLVLLVTSILQMGQLIQAAVLAARVKQGITAVRAVLA
jgi:hypothetical protein